jgi:hypothetical protein
VTTEPLGSLLAGPAIRAVELGAVLAAQVAFCDLTVATTAACVGSPPESLASAGGRWQSVSTEELRALAASEDVLVLGGAGRAR